VLGEDAELLGRRHVELQLRSSPKPPQRFAAADIFVFVQVCNPKSAARQHVGTLHIQIFACIMPLPAQSRRTKEHREERR
jgi:hypothetical protein